MKIVCPACLGVGEKDISEHCEICNGNTFVEKEIYDLKIKDIKNKEKEKKRKQTIEKEQIKRLYYSSEESYLKSKFLGPLKPLLLCLVLGHILKWLFDFNLDITFASLVVYILSFINFGFSPLSSLFMILGYTSLFVGYKLDYINYGFQYMNYILLGFAIFTTFYFYRIWCFVILVLYLLIKMLGYV